VLDGEGGRSVSQLFYQVCPSKHLPHQPDNLSSCWVLVY
jgi:hypothetical protein